MQKAVSFKLLVNLREKIYADLVNKVGLLDKPTDIRQISNASIYDISDNRVWLFLHLGLILLSTINFVDVRYRHIPDPVLNCMIRRFSDSDVLDETKHPPMTHSIWDINCCGGDLLSCLCDNKPYIFLIEIPRKQITLPWSTAPPVINFTWRLLISKNN